MANEFKIKVGMITPNAQVTDLTSSTNTTTGALIVSGGTGIAENLNIGGTLTVNDYTLPAADGTVGFVLTTDGAGTIQFTDPTALVSTPTLDEVTAVGNTTTNDISVANLAVTAVTTSTDSSTGALIVAGGAGIAENLNVGGNLDANGSVTLDTTINNQSLTTTTGSITINDGASTGTLDGFNIGATTAGSANFTTLDTTGDITTIGTVTIDNLTPTVIGGTGSTGALTVTGGVGIQGDLRVDGTIFLDDVNVQQIGQIITTAAGWNLP